MIRALVIVTALAAGAAAAARDGDVSSPEWRVVRVYDGDTFYVDIPELPSELRQVGIRIRGIDTPEVGGRARCASEKLAGHKARNRLISLLRGRIEYLDLAWDKYGGRIDTTVMANGTDVGLVLINEGLARAYDGGVRQGWC